MKHIEVMRKWCKQMGIEIFDKWLIPLDHVTYYQYYINNVYHQYHFYFELMQVFVNISSTHRLTDQPTNGKSEQPTKRIIPSQFPSVNVMQVSSWNLISDERCLLCQICLKPFKEKWLKLTMRETCAVMCRWQI